MRINTKAQSGRIRKMTAFTLIEMIGVLAVIAILAALLIPKVFTAISNARVSNAGVSCDTLKAALADHYAKFGSIPVDGSTNPPTTLTLGAGLALTYDTILLKEGFLDKPFAVKIGDGILGSANTHVEVVDLSGATVGGAVTAPSTMTSGANGGYALSGGATNSITGSALVQAVITGVNESDAQNLSQMIDGSLAGFSSTAIGANDLGGRVKYTAGTPTTVYIYLTHR